MENNFPTNLKFLRIKNNWTQEDLGKRLKKDYSTIGKWELGQRSPTMSDVIKISEVFDIDLKDLIATDLRTNTSYDPTENDLKQILKEKGLMDENDYIDKEKFEKLVQIADLANSLTKKD